MKVYVKAKPNSKENKIVPPKPKLFPDDKEYYIAYTKEPPKDGKANESIRRLIATYFKVPIGSVELQSGFSSKIKVFEL